VSFNKDRFSASAAALGAEIWVMLCTCLVAGGWILSAFRQLNVIGYSGVLAITVLLCWRARPNIVGHGLMGRCTRRFRRPLPMLFLVLAGCALVGGLLYAPTNWDALAYRIPRVLHWLDAERWHWIHSNVPRVNIRAAGFEWLMAPLILFTKSDRALFLINFVSFLLLPGLVFSVFTRVGVRPRVAWFWMWLLPGGYVFALQAGSIGNDSFAAVYALAAVDFALRSQTSRRFKDFAFSLLAVGLLTGSKATNLPLALPWFIAVLPQLPFWPRHKPVATFAISVIAGLISFLPTAVLNHLYTGDWTGLSLESAVVRNLTANSPLAGITAHSLLLALHNLVPPFFPFAGWYNQHFPDFLPSAALRVIAENFNNLGVFYVSEMPGEDGVSGAGFGLTMLLIASLATIGGRGLRLGTVPTTGCCRQMALFLAPFIGACVVMARSGFACNRLMAPFYPFLFASALMFVGHRYVVGRRWWRRLSVAAMALSIIVVAATPPRPLFPAGAVFRTLKAHRHASTLLGRAERVYSVYAERGDALREIRQALPPNVKIVGMACSVDDPEVSLWRPFLTRRVVHVVPGDKPKDIRQRGIDYIVLNGDGLGINFKTTIQDWCRSYGAEIMRQWELPKRASGGNEMWYLVKISDAVVEPGLTLRADSY
jgi:hypothetical protein